MKIRILFFISTLLLSSCNAYRANVQQGNLIDNELLADLVVGMSKRDVISLLGNPLVKDPFHKNRWDYYHYHKDRKSKKEEHHVITLYFVNDVIKRIQYNRDAHLEQKREEED